MNEQIQSGSDTLSSEVSLIRHYQLHNMIGEIMAAVEMLGLTEKQENPLKHMIKGIVWSVWSDDYTFIVPQSLEDKIYKMIDEYRLNQNPIPKMGKAR